MAPITETFVANIHHFIDARGLDLLSFGKGEDKDAIAHRYLAEFPGTDGVLFVGRAQEKAWVFRTQKRRNPATGKEYLWLTRATLQVNYFYFYCVDEDFGPFFIKFCSYFPYGAKLCINGNHWAQRQAEKAGIGFTPMDNAFAAVDDVPALQAICDSFGEEHIRALLAKWLRILPYPFTEDDTAAGIPLRRLRRAGRVQPHPDARQAGHRPDLPGADDPRQPGPRPAGQDQPDLRPPHPQRPQAAHPQRVPHPDRDETT